MKVLILSWRDRDHRDGGGSEVYVHEVARRLVERGHAVTIATSRPDAGPQRVVRDGVLYRRRGGRLTVYLHGLAAVLRTRRERDVVVDVINGLPFWSVLARRSGVVALVHHVHREQWQIIYPDWRGRFGWFIESRVTPRLYRAIPHIAVSESTRSDLEALGIAPESISVVRNGLTSHPALPGGEAQAGPRLIVVSRLVPHKQIEHILLVARALRSEFPSLRVDIVGDGWWRAHLREHSRDWNLDDIVTFHGHVDDAQRDVLLAAATVQLLPSVKEGWGLVVLEAAAQGTPTIGYRSSGGLRESVHDGVTGWLAEDFDDLVALTRSVLNGSLPLAATSEAARAWAGTLDWDNSARAFEHVLEKARAT